MLSDINVAFPKQNVFQFYVSFPPQKIIDYNLLRNQITDDLNLFEFFGYLRFFHNRISLSDIYLWILFLGKFFFSGKRSSDI